MCWCSPFVRCLVTFFRQPARHEAQSPARRSGDSLGQQAATPLHLGGIVGTGRGCPATQAQQGDGAWLVVWVSQTITPSKALSFYFSFDAGVNKLTIPSQMPAKRLSTVLVGCFGSSFGGTCPTKLAFRLPNSKVIVCGFA